VYAFFIAVFVYKEMRLIDVAGRAAQSSVDERHDPLHHHQCGGISWLLTSSRFPQSMAEWMTAQGFRIVAFLLVTNIVLLAAGNFMDPPPSC